MVKWKIGKNGSFQDFLVKKIDFFFFLAVMLAGFLIRWAGKDFVTDDMQGFFIPWMEKMRAEGTYGLVHNLGDYNVLFQTITLILSYIPLLPMYIYKLFTTIFDVLMAFLCADFAVGFSKGQRFQKKYNLVFAFIFLLPTVVLNSAYWGQVDVIYSFFLLLTVIALLKEKYYRGFVWLGIAFAFKLQSVFLLPFVLVYCLKKRQLRIRYLFLAVVVFWGTSVPAIFFGRSRLDVFRVYLGQTSGYGEMYMGATSFWVLLGNNYEFLKDFAVLFTLFLCGIGAYFILTEEKKLDSKEQVLNTAAWFVWTCVFFLPAMHDRYSYFLDILLILLSFIDRKYIKYAVVSFGINLLNYGRYLFETAGASSEPYAILFFVAWLYYSHEILTADRELGRNV